MRKEYPIDLIRIVSGMESFRNKDSNTPWFNNKNGWPCTTVMRQELALLLIN